MDISEGNCVSVPPLFDLIRSELSLHLDDCNPGVAFACNRQSERLLKKWCPGGVASEAASAALDKFIAVNGSLATPVIEPTLLCEAKSYIAHVLELGIRSSYNDRYLSTPPISGCIDIPTIAYEWRIGPGASMLATGTHFCEKMAGTLSYTTACRKYIPYLERICPEVFLHDSARSPYELTPGSKVAPVPKTPEIARLVAVEPTVNMCLQLGVAQVLQKGLVRCGLDISTQQDRNQLLAKLGSERGDGIGCRFATLDLESASDRISLDLVKMLLPSDWYHFLCDIRSPVADVRSHGPTHLNMISTMGNGFTFPLMTLIFSAFVYAVQRTYMGTPRNYVDWTRAGVFGDDIIVDVSLVNPLVKLLQGAGLVVNRAKSFDTGYFRESCGGDFYIGFDVTPFYIKSLSTDRDRVIAFNIMARWCLRTGVLLPNSLAALYASIDPNKRNIVPLYESDDAGIKRASGPNNYVAWSYKGTPSVFRGDTQFHLACVIGGYLARGSSSTHTSDPADIYISRDAKIVCKLEQMFSITQWSYFSSFEYRPRGTSGVTSLDRRDREWLELTILGASRPEWNRS